MKGYAILISVLLIFKANGQQFNQQQGQQQPFQQQQNLDGNYQNGPNTGPFSNLFNQNQLPHQGVQGMINPFLHAGASISHSAFEVGKGFLRWPLKAISDIQFGITGLFNSFANPAWAPPPERPYDLTLGELLNQIQQGHSSTSTTEAPFHSNTQRPQQQNRPQNG